MKSYIFIVKNNCNLRQYLFNYLLQFYFKSTLLKTMSGAKKHRYGEPLSYLGNDNYGSGPGYGTSPKNRTVDYGYQK